ncbi:MAG TPA: hypothetical protein VLD37_00040 [Candidatus Bilamarchaeum sp.]|nr:hypothetical protein [Candidatus Bilamarchaeum sp.]
MRLFMFFKLLLLCICAGLLWFGLAPGASLMGLLKIFALGIVASVAITVVYPEVRGIRAGDSVSVVTDSGIPSLIGRAGRAAAAGKKNDHIKILLQNGTEVMGIVESYTGIISPPRIRILYEERLVE